MILGYMPVPKDFKYINVFLKGKPSHAGLDLFRVRHPVMDCGCRAKIFSPFDALAGFSESVASKNILYVDKPEPDDEEKAEINRKLGILYELIRSGKRTGKTRMTVKVVYFVLCTDRNHTAYGCKGRCVSVTGICRRVDGTIRRSITVGNTVIRFSDILSIDAEGLFDEDRK